MPLTTLDEVPALIVVDLQKRIAARRTTHLARRPHLPSLATVVDNAYSLAAEFRARGLPVVLVTAISGAPGRTDARRAGRQKPATRPDDWSQPLDDLDPQDSDIRITKRGWGAFQNTKLADVLAERNVTQVILAGVATSIGVESTARCAHERGLHVVLATDAMTDSNADAHRNSLTHIFPRLGETARTRDILTKLRSND